MTHSQLLHEPSPEAQQHPHWELVERVAASQGFRSSPRLRDFLYYVCDCALRNAPEEATEQQIGMHVFRRLAGYNSSEDSIVRTQARGLRQKLTEYFNEEGAHEETIIEMPKGHYLLVFRPRVPVAEPDRFSDGALSGGNIPASPAARLQIDLPHPLRRWRLYLLLLLGGVVAALAAWEIGVSISRRKPIERFWAPFVADNNSLLIYSNALFVGDSTNGLRYAPVTVPSPLGSGNYVDTYTGIGELTSVYDLTRLFDQHHATFTLKRSLLVTWDEAKLNNLIFIGSIAENSSLRVLPNAMDFSLTAGSGFAGIVNHHPRPGEQALYSRPEHPLTKDYAILALLPGLQSGRKMLIFSGLTTMGTQAAVEFTCRRDTLQELLKIVTGPKGELLPFEAVLETSIGGDVPLQTRIVAIHLR
jgi:hypothetical protein